VYMMETQEMSDEMREFFPLTMYKFTDTLDRNEWQCIRGFRRFQSGDTLPPFIMQCLLVLLDTDGRYSYSYQYKTLTKRSPISIYYAAPNAHIL